VDPDLLLLEQWRGGDEQAGHQLFARHFAAIYRFFEHKSGSEADELTQRTFLACVAAKDQFRSQSSFRTYLFTIARNELYAHLRRQTHNQALDFELTSIAEIATSPSSRLDRARRIDRLRCALAELPAEQQLLLELHYWHDLEAAELAEVFGASAGTIRVRLLRARRALRERIAASAPETLTGEADDRLTASLAAADAEDDAAS
jgi:RNA polymerase sigma-70 factor (ECF subfamily)